MSPLSHFNCSICGVKCPKKYLSHGFMAQRMSWLRHHYELRHPYAFGKKGK